MRARRREKVGGRERERVGEREGGRLLIIGVCDF